MNAILAKKKKNLNFKQKQSLNFAAINKEQKE